MKIRPVGEELFHAAGQTDMTKLIFAFIAILRTRQKTANPTMALTALSDHYPQMGA
jgi:hypothetical protein